jgi:hypothetical protein
LTDDLKPPLSTITCTPQSPMRAHSCHGTR